VNKKLGALFQVSLNTWIRIGVGVAIVLLVATHESRWVQFRALQQTELLSYDARLRLFMPRGVDPRIVILDIDEKSLNAEGRWPWGRDRVALMVRQAFEKYGVRVLAFDVAFAEADASSGLPNLERAAAADLKDNAAFQDWLARNRAALDHDRILADEIKKWPVVLGYFLGVKDDRAGVLPLPGVQYRELGKPGWEFRHTLANGYSGNIEILQKNAAGAGHLSPLLDIDGVTRRVPMFMRYGDGLYEAMSLAATRLYLGNVPLRMQVEPPSGGGAAVLGSVRLDKLNIPLDEGMNALVPYRSAYGAFRYVSATDVIRGTLGPDELKDKIVIVGTTAQGLLDLRSTPVREDFPGVEVHANLIGGFLDQRIMHEPDYITGFSVFVALLLGLPFAVMLPRLSALMSTAAVAIVVVVYIAFNLWAWKAQNYVFSLAPPLIMLLTLYLFNMAWGFFSETRSRKLITGLFGTYVPKELVAEMSKNPEEYSMRGESRQMTVLFSDVRDFTSISEGLSPADLKELMNIYLTAMTEVIQETRGTIDKYIGDAIMAFWGAPLNDAQHAEHGVQAALAMQARIRKLDPEFDKRGWPRLNIGVGLNCGEMNVGDMGSRFRRAYTVLGDAVNIASRLEGLTKEYGAGILVSESMVDAAPGVVYREVDLVAVKGRTTGIPIYEPVGRIGEVGETTLAELEKWHRALELYRKQHWDEAVEILTALKHAAPEYKLYRLYLKRIDHWRDNTPGPQWKGLWTWTTK
jgi:adenylate cyclase